MEFAYLPVPGVVIAQGGVGYLGGLGREGEGRQVLLEVGIRGVQAGEHAGVGVAPEALPEEAGQLGVTVGDVGRGVPLAKGHVVQR